MNIERFRGDTTPIRVKITKKKVPLDISGFTFLLTVHTNQMPDGNDYAIQVAATIEDGPGGLILFDLQAEEVDRVGLFYYDMQLTDTQGKVLTFKVGTMKFKQDITK